MHQVTVQVVYEWLDGIAPFASAESYDNVGLLIGRMDAAVSNILVALDIVPGVLDEAKQIDAQLIITHHPLMFHGTKRILENDYEGKLICRLVREKLNMIACHTNLDLSPLYSGTAALAKLLKLDNIMQDGYVIVGDIPDGPVDACELKKRISLCENDSVYLYGKQNARISRLGICGGAYDEGFVQARSMGAQAFLTGEVRHHNALAASGSDFVIYQGGHYGTEAPLVPNLSNALQKALNELKYDVKVYPSAVRPFAAQPE